MIWLAFKYYMILVGLYLAASYFRTMWGHRTGNGAWGHTRRWYRGRWQWIQVADLKKLGFKTRWWL